MQHVSKHETPIGQRAARFRWPIVAWCKPFPLAMCGAIAVACSSSSTPTAPYELYGMRLTATAELTHDSTTSAPAFAATLTVTNVADTTVRVFWAECPSNGPFVLFAYAPGKSTAVWDATDAYAKVNCFAVRHYADIPARQTWQHSVTVPTRDILGDSLPAGRYHLTGSAKWLEPGFPQELSLGDFDIVK